MKVPGIGVVKAQRYGRVFLDLIGTWQQMQQASAQQDRVPAP
jgi:adenosyl cobinamide kinase/adenosyl cobinamide phosphate guanylyltransferase